MKTKRDAEETKNGMEIVWQAPANPPQKHDYIFHDGRRHVRPYCFEFISHVKNRWAGKTIVDLFAEEFKGRPYNYYVSAVKCGRIQVDGEMVSVSYIVKPSQKISHFVHRHEPPVNAREISVLQKDPDVVAICKPATVPVHPCGQYRKNTVVGILQAEHDLAPLFHGEIILEPQDFMQKSIQWGSFLDEYAVHRLDRLVSGLLILARNSLKADFFRQEMEAGKMEKQYVAKVVGIFPEDEQVVDVNINYNAQEGMSTLEVGESCGNSSAKGKAACTKFTRISTNGTYSIVLCKPVTGRTHQIRVHFQYTGHPIANDFLYLSEYAANRSVEGMSADRAARVSSSLTSLNCTYDEHRENSGEDFSIDPMCTSCPNLAPKGYDVYEEGLWLHCVQYSGSGWVYECPYPDWAFLT